MLELMKPFLYGNHDSHSISKRFFAFIERIVTRKTSNFQMLPETTIFDFRTLEFVS